MPQCSRGRCRFRHRYPRGVSFDEIHEYSRREGEARARPPLSPFDLAPNPGHFFYSSARAARREEERREEEARRSRS